VPQGIHSKSQTAFRLPEGLLARLKAQAEREDVTMTSIVQRALERELAPERGRKSDCSTCRHVS